MYLTHRVISKSPFVEGKKLLLELLLLSGLLAFLVMFLFLFQQRPIIVILVINRWIFLPLKSRLPFFLVCGTKSTLPFNYSDKLLSLP